MTELTDQQKAILDFERTWWKYAGAKEAEVRRRFDMSIVRYYQVLNATLDHPAAMAYDVMVVKRLRGLRDGRRRVRTAG